MNFHRKTGHKRRRPSNSGQSDSGKKGPRREHIEELHPTDSPPDIDSFDEWNLDEQIQRAIRNMEITVPTPIQALAIGPVLEGRDVIAKAETGTGKTLAFGAPMMSRIDAERSTVLGLVLCPTRELAQQVAEVLAALALPRGVRVALVVGGDPMHPQIAQLQAGAQVVVGTPGRVLDLYQQRFLSFPWTETIVLDEADKMFEIGFLDDIKKILSYLPDERQTLLFSATFPTEVLKLARNSTRDPMEVATQRGLATVESIRQVHMRVNEEDRALTLTRLMEQSGEKDVFLVFCERRTDVDRLFRRLERLPFGIKALHGGYDQAARFRVMSAFRTGEVKALLATDVASRGLDVKHVSHVINFSVPRELEDYTHRIGRTGRAGRTGNAITFVSVGDDRRWRQLVDRASWDIPEEDPPGRYARPKRGADRDSRGSREPREARERQSSERQPRERQSGEREPRERQASEQQPRERQSRDRRPARDQAGRDQRRGRDRDERPASTPRSEEGARQDRARQPERRPQSEKPAAETAANGPQPFGSLPELTKAKKPERKPRRARPEKGREDPKESRRPKPTSPEKKPSTGFGAGL